MAQVQSSNVVTRRATGPIRRHVGRWGERLGIALIVLGIAGLIQPWLLDGFTRGFLVLLVGTVIFIITSHL